MTSATRRKSRLVFGLSIMLFSSTLENTMPIPQELNSQAKKVSPWPSLSSRDYTNRSTTSMRTSARLRSGRVTAPRPPSSATHQTRASRANSWSIDTRWGSHLPRTTATIECRRLRLSRAIKATADEEAGVATPQAIGTIDLSLEWRELWNGLL